MFYRLVLAHLLGDFVLQTRWLVVRKHTPVGLAAHVGLVGLAMLAVAWDRLAVSGRAVLVLGGEARGPRPAVIRACDQRVAIPLARGVDSLNVAVAAGVLLFELVRRRRGAPGGLETSETR